MVKECYYKLLNVERDIETKKLKRAYRKAAAKWHPDKNYGNEEEATAMFKKIAEAYEVLSDPHERAWYDSHREQILLGVDPNSNEAGDDLNLWSFFSSSCYTDYDNSLKGFYCVYEKVFKDIYNIEVISNPDLEACPSFGRSNSPWEITSAFYKHWRGFRSSRTFAHADQWKPSDARNRRERRYIEKENKQLRSEERKKFNELVNRLVDFVKKRDPRVQEHNQEAAREQQRKEKEEREERERLEAERAEKFRLAKEERLRKEQELWETNPELFEVEDVHLYECVVCNKVFKSEKSLKNHEKSNAHKKKLKKLKRELDQEEVLLGLSGDVGKLKFQQEEEDVQSLSEPKKNEHNERQDDDFDIDEADSEELLAMLERGKKKKKKKKKRRREPPSFYEDEETIESVQNSDEPELDDQLEEPPHETENVSDDDFVEEDDDLDSEELLIAMMGRGKKKKKKKKNRRRNAPEYDEEEITRKFLAEKEGVDHFAKEGSDSEIIEKHADDDSAFLDNSEEEFQCRLARPSKKKKKKRRQQRQSEREEEEMIARQYEAEMEKSDEEEYLPTTRKDRKKKGRRRKKQTDLEADEQLETNQDIKFADLPDEAVEEKKKKGKRRRKREKPARQSHEPQPSNVAYRCRVCEKEFSSKNKLFQHLKKFPKHAMIIMSESSI